MRHVLKKLRFHGNCSLVFFGVPLYESILVSQVLLSAECVLIFTVCIHTHPLTLLTQVEDTICSNIWFPAFLLSLSLSLYLYFFIVLVVFFIHTSGGQFVQAIVFPLSFSQECPEPETKTGPFVTQTAIDLQRRTLYHIASQKSF